MRIIYVIPIYMYRGFQVGCHIPSSHITHAHTDWPANSKSLRLKVSVNVKSGALTCGYMAARDILNSESDNQPENLCTWLVRRLVGLRMCDMLNSESDNQPENLCTVVHI